MFLFVLSLFCHFNGNFPTILLNSKIAQHNFVLCASMFSWIHKRLFAYLVGNNLMNIYSHKFNPSSHSQIFFIFWWFSALKSPNSTLNLNNFYIFVFRCSHESPMYVCMLLLLAALWLWINFYFNSPSLIKIQIHKKKYCCMP